MTKIIRIPQYNVCCNFALCSAFPPSYPHRFLTKLAKKYTIATLNNKVVPRFIKPINCHIKSLKSVGAAKTMPVGNTKLSNDSARI